MPIKFPKLLQDSFNFMRNHMNFTIMAVVLAALVQIVNQVVALKTMPQTMSAAQSGQIDALLFSMAPMIIFGVVNIFLTTLFILNIRSINDGNYSNFFQNLGSALKAFIPVVILNFVMVLPLSVGMSFAQAAQLGQEAFGLVSLPLFITGIFIFIKLCLVSYTYLVESPQMKIGQTLKFTWALGKGKTLALLAFCVLAYLFPSMLLNVLARLVGSSMSTAILLAVVSSIISVFIVVFGYRFYQAFRQQGE